MRSLIQDDKTRANKQELGQQSNLVVFCGFFRTPPWLLDRTVKIFYTFFGALARISLLHGSPWALPLMALGQVQRPVVSPDKRDHTPAP